jgi:hypothetical protein
MVASSFGPESLSLCTVGVVAAVLGLLTLVLAPSRSLGWRPLLAGAVALGLVGGGLAVAGASDVVWLPALTMAGVAAAFALTVSPLLTLLSQRLAQLARHPRGQGALLLLGGGGVLLWQVTALERAASADVLAHIDWGAELRPPELRPRQDVVAQTDAGRQVPLYIAAEDDGPRELSATHLRERKLEQRLIQTGPASNETNCHGWVFAAGRHWVRGAFVPFILEDNGYSPVSAPAAGDLAVFRDASNQVSHSAIVRSASDGVILLESKWGRAGRYVHSPDDHIYRGASCTYYRTDRGSHRLRGLANAAVRPSARNARVGP